MGSPPVLETRPRGWARGWGHPFERGRCGFLVSSSARSNGAGGGLGEGREPVTPASGRAESAPRLWSGLIVDFGSVFRASARLADALWLYCPAGMLGKGPRRKPRAVAALPRLAPREGSHPPASWHRGGSTSCQSRTPHEGFFSPCALRRRLPPGAELGPTSSTAVGGVSASLRAWIPTDPTSTLLFQALRHG